MAILREQLKQAIDLIAVDDPVAGRDLDALLASGGIGPCPADDETMPEREIFSVLGEAATVPRSRLFLHGPRTLAERLLVKYGEAIMRNRLAAEDGPATPAEDARRIYAAGPRYLVDHELRRMLAKGPAPPATATLLREILAEDPQAPLHAVGDDRAVLYTGIVNRDTPATFMRFPWGRRALEQVADLNPEFFGIGRLLDWLCRDRDPGLFAAVVAGRLAGLLRLTSRREFGRRRLEIKYLATRSGPESLRRPPIRGVGALLVAGAWLQWHLEHGGAHKLVLNSEPDALSFYEAQGFRRVRTCAYVLGTLRGRSLRCLIAMANRIRDLPDGVAAEIARLAGREAGRLARACPARQDDWSRPELLRAALFFEECFRVTNLPSVSRAAVGRLVARGQGKDLCERLLESAAEYGLVRRAGRRTLATAPVLVVMDDRFAGHLSHILHLEGPGRLAALQDALDRVELRNTWLKVPVRRATTDELARVHTHRHISRIARTAGRPYTVLNADTETTAESYDAARLAVGGLLNLLDDLLAGPSRRGFACLRPPGHHAEPDRPNGFCLFNNVALGACHLLERHGLDRIMIIDVDAHHGNGTQSAFYATDAVLFVSLHQADAVPGTGNVREIGTGRGTGYTINLPLPPRQGDLDLVTVLRRFIPPLARAYRPEFLLVSCGFDLYAHDPLGKMSVTPDGYALMTSLLCATADEVAGGRIALVLEGGYSRDGLRSCGAAVMRSLAAHHEEIERYRRFMAHPLRSVSHLEKLAARHATRWPV